MDQSDPDVLLAKRGPMDGQKFFFQSPFKSPSFLVVTLVCFAGCILSAVIVYQNSHKLSFFEGTYLLGIAGGGLASTWYRAFRYHDRIRELFQAGHFPDLPTGSPIDIVLGAAASAMIEILFFCTTTIVFLFLVLGFVLARSA